MLVFAAHRSIRFAAAGRQRALNVNSKKWSKILNPLNASVQNRHLVVSKKEISEKVESKDVADTENRFRSPTHSPSTSSEELEPKKKSNTFELAQYMTRQMRKGVGGIFSAVGFVSSATTALLTDRAQFQRFKPTVEALRNFLKTSGIDLEFSKSLNHRLLDNVIILRRIQNAILEGVDRRDLALLSPSRSLEWIPTREEALRYMKYATAVYGESMIRSAEMDVKGTWDNRLSRLTKSRISDHIGVPEEDIVLMNVDYTGDFHNLRHFVAIDHANKKIVLSIRGTFSLSEVVIDVAGFSRSFCGGEAHSEIASMAERVWEAAGTTVLKFLEEHRHYEFVLVGHSLGAGTACLLNILCHRNQGKMVHGRKTRCFAYASPPVFTPSDSVPKAVNSCINFIHERDVVPFLSVDSVRHLFAEIGAIEEQTQKMNWISRMRLVTGYMKPDKPLLEAVQQANTMRLEPKPGAPILATPAASTWWIREKEMSGKYDIKRCDAEKLATLGVIIDPKMLEDHFPSRYEHALHNLED